MRPLIVYPPKDTFKGGKYHAKTLANVAVCGYNVEVGDNPADAIFIMPGEQRVHPIVCKRCVAQWRKEN